MLKAILILPFNVLITIPLFILYFNGFEIIGTKNIFLLFLTPMLFISGLTLMFWTMKLFAQVGKGSPAPWDPINKLITHGPYAYVRNPHAPRCFFVLGRRMPIVPKPAFNLLSAYFYRDQSDLFSVN